MAARGCGRRVLDLDFQARIWVPLCEMVVVFECLWFNVFVTHTLSNIET